MAACAVFYEDGLLLTFKIAIFISVTAKYVFELSWFERFFKGLGL